MNATQYNSLIQVDRGCKLIFPSIDKALKLIDSNRENAKFCDRYSWNTKRSAERSADR